MQNLRLELNTTGQGLFDFTDQVSVAVTQSGIHEGLAQLFLRHTSASLVIQENADPKVLADLQQFMQSLVPEDPRLYTHNDEGPDDMPAHIKASLTQTHLNIPIVDGALALGTWQGIYLWEHRAAPHKRNLILSLQSFDRPATRP